MMSGTQNFQVAGSEVVGEAVVFQVAGSVKSQIERLNPSAKGALVGIGILKNGSVDTFAVDLNCDRTVSAADFQKGFLGQREVSAEKLRGLAEGRRESMAILLARQRAPEDRLSPFDLQQIDRGTELLRSFGTFRTFAVDLQKDGLVSISLEQNDAVW